MATVINKELLKHLAGLSKLKLTIKETNKFLKDLSKILEHFRELEKLDTKSIAPMIGGTSLKNVFREDTVDLDRRAQTVNDTGRIIDAFPESEKGYLKVPRVLK